MNSNGRVLLGSWYEDRKNPVNAGLFPQSGQSEVRTEYQCMTATATQQKIPLFGATLHESKNNSESHIDYNNTIHPFVDENETKWASVTSTAHFGRHANDSLTLKNPSDPVMATFRAPMDRTVSITDGTLTIGHLPESTVHIPSENFTKPDRKRYSAPGFLPSRFVPPPTRVYSGSPKSLDALVRALRVKFGATCLLRFASTVPESFIIREASLANPLYDFLKLKMGLNISFDSAVELSQVYGVISPLGGIVVRADALLGAMLEPERTVASELDTTAEDLSRTTSQTTFRSLRSAPVPQFERFKRVRAIRTAWQSLLWLAGLENLCNPENPSEMQTVPLDFLLKAFDATAHADFRTRPAPRFPSGVCASQMSSDLQFLLAGAEKTANSSFSVSYETFLDYFLLISVGVEDSDVFIHMLNVGFAPFRSSPSTRPFKTHEEEGLSSLAFDALVARQTLSGDTTKLFHNEGLPAREKALETVPVVADIQKMGELVFVVPVDPFLNGTSPEGLVNRLVRTGLDRSSIKYAVIRR